jgi:hypothetical protein
VNEDRHKSASSAVYRPLRLIAINLAIGGNLSNGIQRRYQRYRAQGAGHCSSPWERLNKNSLPEIIGHFLADSRDSSDPLLTFIHHGSEPFQADGPIPARPDTD